MLSHLEYCDLLQAQYDATPGVFDHDFTDQNDDRYCIKYYPDCTVVAHEGSHDPENWYNNARFDMIRVQRLGGVAQGFYVGIPEATKQAIPLLPTNKPIYVIGHSRAGPRAWLMAALLRENGYTPIVVTFACPRVGDAIFAATVKGIEGYSYRNYHNLDQQDFVCDVPFPHPFGYVHPIQPILIDVAPDQHDEWGIFARHHLFLYRRGLLCAH